MKFPVLERFFQPISNRSDAFDTGGFCVYFVCIFSKINSANQNRPNVRLANGSDSGSVLSAWFDCAGSGNSYQIDNTFINFYSSTYIEIKGLQCIEHYFFRKMEFFSLFILQLCILECKRASQWKLQSSLHCVSVVQSNADKTHKMCPIRNRFSEQTL